LGQVLPPLELSGEQVEHTEMNGAGEAQEEVALNIPDLGDKRS